jgi:hypothetical protein
VPGYAFRRSEISYERNQDTTGAPTEGCDEVLALQISPENPGEDEPFDQSNRGIDGEVFPEYVIGLNWDDEENADSEHYADPQSEQSKPCRCSPPRRRWLP